MPACQWNNPYLFYMAVKVARPGDGGINNRLKGSIFEHFNKPPSEAAECQVNEELHLLKPFLISSILDGCTVQVISSHMLYCYTASMLLSSCA